MKQAFVYLVLAALSAGATTAPVDDAKAIEGTWLPVTAVLGGRPMDDAVRKSIRLKLEGGAYEVLVGEAPDRGTYTVDATTVPKGMTITGTEGPNKGRTFPAIYELGKDGGTLRICYDLSCKQRPTEFKSTVGTRLYLVTYERKKQ